MDTVNEKALVLASGGLDSTVLLADVVQRFGAENVYALSILYGQKHARELQAAKEVTRYYGVAHQSIDITPVFAHSTCSLLAHSDSAIPHASYDEQLQGSQGTPVSTYVPFRNGLFLSTAASVALSLDCSVVYYGAHADDAAGNAYPDCSPEFVWAMNQAIIQGSGDGVSLQAPFIHKTKADIVAQGISLDVPFELTWSCYEGGQKPCGQCGTCIDRALAFEKNNTTDPLLG